MEQSTCKEAERELVRARSELNLERADKLKARAWMAHTQELLKCERRFFDRRDQAFREALRAELRDQNRLSARLSAAQSRIRELEELLLSKTPRDHDAFVLASAPTHRVWVDGWAGCCSLC
ncbi:MAG: hypothetical protein AB1758_01960 [Candidatus Eremiobacterota bacterium]